MFAKLLSTVFGDKHSRTVKKLSPIVEEIHTFEEDLLKSPDEYLRQRMDEFRAEIRQHREEAYAELPEDLEARDEGELEILKWEKEYLLEALPEVFAIVKDACRRNVGVAYDVCGITKTWDMVPYDVQLIGGAVLHDGKIAEMATGEGKTLVAVLPICLNALTGRGVHLVTVNDYLAKRDSEWMGLIYRYLGFTIGCLQNDMESNDRRTAYDYDIIYGTNSEFGFDYLRDNMAYTLGDMVQFGNVVVREIGTPEQPDQVVEIRLERRFPHHFAIVDEVDSVLIDEARTPLIISGPVPQSDNNTYNDIKPRVERVVREQMSLTNRLVSQAEQLLQKGGEDYEVGRLLLLVRRGAPKNKKLLNLLKETGVKELVKEVEHDRLRDKNMHELDEDLYFVIDEREHVTDLTDKGRNYLSPNDPEFFTIPDHNMETSAIEAQTDLPLEEKAKQLDELQKRFVLRSEQNHAVQQLLRAYMLFERDVEYVIQEGKILIVDEFTGRLMPGRRYSEGLHQAIEAKESVKVEGETQTMATVTLQNYFRLYKKLAGMTGTADTEATEFWEIYKLDVTVIPTNRPVKRWDHPDVLMRSRREKYNAVIAEIIERHKEGRPVLVGTVSVEVSETLSRMLKRVGVPHQVLNARYHQQEAEIVAAAGQPGAVTIATNMAGRGTDIKLGVGLTTCTKCGIDMANAETVCPNEKKHGDCEMRSTGGLHIIGTERHESRRIDLQLRGRAGRQGDPGSSRFYLSIEDDLLRLFGYERLPEWAIRPETEDGRIAEHPLIDKIIGQAQKKVEAQNFGARKHLLEYDDVMNKHRQLIYTRRMKILRGEGIREEYQTLIEECVETLVEKHTESDEWSWAGLKNDFRRIFAADLKLGQDVVSRLQTQELLFEYINQEALEAYANREKYVGAKAFRGAAQNVYLGVIDDRWRDHLYEMDQLKGGIGFRAYAQKDPLVEYKREGYKTFIEMIEKISDDTLARLFNMPMDVAQKMNWGRLRVPIQIIRQEALSLMQMAAMQREAAEQRQQMSTNNPEAAPPKPKPIRVAPKVGRNDLCPCGSGKKYKRCCGANEEEVE